MIGYRRTQSPVCLSGDTTSEHQVLLIGDSKAAQWSHALHALGRQRGWKVRVLAKAACPLEDLPPFRLRAIRRVYVACNQWRERTIQAALTSRPSLILLASSKNYTVGPDAVVTLDEWQNATQRMLRKLRSAGVPVGLFRDTPSFPINVPDCLGRPGADQNGGSRCSIERAAAVGSEPFAHTRAAVAAVGGQVFTIDLTDALCPQPVCEVIIDRVIGYKDADHLSPAMAARLAAPLSAQIDKGLRAISGPTGRPKS